MSGCTVAPSGMGDAAFEAGGRELSVRMGWITEALTEAPGPEEMVAVLEGSVVLVTGDERHSLGKGLGVLIPAGRARRWELEAPALLYRVRAAG